jgi:CSLREA domain-containing protein
VTSKSRRTARTSPLRRQSGRYRRLRFEFLEDRRLLATFMVNTLSDDNADNPDLSLREAIILANATPGDDTINFSVSGTIALTNAQPLPSLSSNITINGPGKDQLTLDAGNRYRVFFVSPGSTVTISGLTISHGEADKGGGLYNDSGDVTIAECALTDNLALGSAGAAGANGSTGPGQPGTEGGLAAGGGIYIAGGTLRIDRTVLTRNTATGGTGGAGGIGGANSSEAFVGAVGGSGGEGAGGAVYHSVGILTITNSSIIANTATGGAGGMGGTGGLWDGFGSSNDHAGIGGLGGQGSWGRGGGVYVADGALTLNQATFTENVAAGGEGGDGGTGGGTRMTGTIATGGAGDAGGDSEGGAVFLAKGILETAGGEVSNNSAVGGAGGIGGLTGGSTTMRHKGGAGGNGYGGGLHASGGTIHSDGILMERNVVQGGVGGIGLPAQAASGMAYGAGLYMDQGTATFSHTTIADHEISGRGAGVYLQGGDLTLSDSTLENNQTTGEVTGPADTVPAPGAAIYLAAGRLSLARCVVRLNLAAGNGAGAFIEGDATVDVSASSFSDNQAPGGYGGGMYIAAEAGSSPRVTISESILLRNSAKSGGGAVAAVGGTLAITGSQLLDNSASSGGAFLLISGAQVRVERTEVGRNTAIGSGGGGGFHISDGTALEIVESTLSDNRAPYGKGGGVYAGVANGVAPNVTITRNSNLLRNFAAGDGGAIAITSGDLTISGSRIQDNSAVSSGGGIYVGDAGLSLSDSFVERNTARDGAGVYLAWWSRTIATVTISDSTVGKNLVDGGMGAGIYNGGRDLDITRTTVEDNEITGQNLDTGPWGAGIYHGSGNLTIRDSTVARNAAWGADGANGKLVCSGFPNNECENKPGSDGVAAMGGGLFIVQGNVQILQSTFSDNEVTGGAGGSGVSDAGPDGLGSTPGGVGGYGLGGGVYAEGGTLTITSSTIAGNKGVGGPGGIGGEPDFAKSPDGRGQGAGVYLASAVTARIDSTLVAVNTTQAAKTAIIDAPDVLGTVTSLGHNLIGIGDGSSGLTQATDQVGTAAAPIDPRLGLLQDNGGPTATRALATDSPAKDKGWSGEPNDQRGPGYLRQIGAAVDVGAYEYNPNATQQPTVNFAVTAQTASESAGTVNVTVQLNPAPIQTVTVPFTVSGTASNPADYTYSPASPLTFAAGQASKTIAIPLVDDNVAEATETVVVTLGSPTNAQMGTPTTFTLQITDNDTPGVIVTESSGATAVTEGGATDTYTLVLATKPSADVVITLTPNSQLTVAPTSLTFTPSNWSTSQPVTVTAVDDTAVEGNHSGVIQHTAASTDSRYDGITIPTVTAAITDNDASAGLAISPHHTEQLEGTYLGNEWSWFSYTVTRSGPLTETATVDWSVTGSGAYPVDAADFFYGVWPGGTLTFQPNQTEQEVWYLVVEDSVAEPDETFTVTLSNAANAQIAVGTATGTILNDDGGLAISPYHAEQLEGTYLGNEWSLFSYTVTRSGPLTEIATVDWSVTGSGAHPVDAADFFYGVWPGGTLTFQPNQTEQEVWYLVVEDSVAEPDETFTVTLSNAANAQIAVGTATGTILNDDGGLAISPYHAEQLEGTYLGNEWSLFSYTVTRSGPLTEIATVDWSVTGSGAHPVDAADFFYGVWPGGTLTFQPNQTEQEVWYLVVEDSVAEPDETFTVTLSNAVNAQIAVGTATGTILNDDGAVGAPGISSLSPVDNATGVAVGTNLVLTFTENIQKGTGNIVLKKSSDNSTLETIAVGSAAVSVSGVTATIDPTATLAGSTGYYVEVAAGAFEDLSGNDFAGISGAGSWNFTTADTTAPGISSLLPVDNATGVAVGMNLVLTFTENIQKGTGNIVLKKSSDNSTVETIAVGSTAVSVSGVTATIDPAATLAGSTGYYVEVAAGAFEDLSGNDFAGISGAGSWNFTTADSTPPQVSSIHSPTPNGAYGAGQVIDVAVQFSEPVTVIGTPTLTLETGVNDRTASYVGGSGSQTLTFRYTVQAGDTSADLDYTSSSALSLAGGTIRDSAGNAAALTLPTPGAAGSLGANKTLVIDTTAPLVTVASLTTSDPTPMITGTVSDGTLQVAVNGRTYTAGDGRLTVSGMNWTLQIPDSDALVPGTYNVAASATDAAGNTGGDATTNELQIAAQGLDFGDAPLPYPTTLAEDGARHARLGLTLGARADSEVEGTHSEGADLDDVTGAVDDEDGVTFGSLRVGQLGATVPVAVQNASGGARLDAWLDFDGDGSWGGPWEQIANSVAVVNGPNVLRFDVPSWAAAGSTVARFRLSTTGNLGIRGLASDGEVEDHQVIIQPPSRASGVFGTPQTIFVADKPWSVFAADVDGDGDTDILSPSVAAGSIYWYENDGAAAFTQHALGGAVFIPFAVFAVDMDGDGDMDVLTASAAQNSIVWYDNDGSENFTLRTISTSLSAASLFPADVDGDGDTDVVIASTGGDTIAWCENDGTQTFTTRTIAAGVDGAISVRAADVDRDGDMDVVGVSMNGDTIAWYENDGGQNFTARTISNTADEALSVFATDMDGDGDTDVVSASAGDNTIAWYENDGRQDFTSHVITGAAAGASCVWAADVDGDGDVDVVSSSAEDNRITWYENDGLQRFTPRVITAQASYASAVFLADIDGDGDMDVLSASRDDGKVAWYEHQSLASHTNPDIAEDVDGNGSVGPLDVLWIINEINANGPHTLPSPPGAPFPPPFLDVDGNGSVTANDVLLVINHLNSQFGAGEGESRWEAATMPGVKLAGVKLAGVPNKSMELLPDAQSLAAELWDDEGTDAGQAAIPLGQAAAGSLPKIESLLATTRSGRRVEPRLVRGEQNPPAGVDGMLTDDWFCLEEIVSDIAAAVAAQWLD